MKKSILLFVLVVVVQLLALDKTLITVKDSSVNNGVIIVTIHEGGKPYELQCNQSMPNCSSPKSGDYWMVRLAKNHGLYDCTNVDLYPQAVDPESEGTKVFGEYCLNEK